MRRSKSQSNINTVVGLVAAILMVNVLIFFVVTRDKGKSKKEGPIASAHTQAPRAAVGDAAIGQIDLKIDDEEPAAELPLEIIVPEEGGDAARPDDEANELVETATESDAAKPDDEADELVETATESDNSKRNNKRYRGRNDRNARNRREGKAVKAVIVAPPAAKVEPQRAKTNITTVPSGATISIDGIFIGKSPIIGLSITSGNHSVAVSYTGYQPKVSRLKIGHGGLERLKIRLEKKIELPKTVALAPAAPTFVIKRVSRGAATPRVGKSTMGSESRGRSLLANTCNSCHSKEGARRVSTKKYTRSQWNRFFASGKHDRYQRLGGKIGTGQLADVKAYVMSKAADAERNQGAGIR